MKKQLKFLLVVLALTVSACAVDTPPADEGVNISTDIKDSIDPDLATFPITGKEGVVWRSIVDPQTGVTMRCLWVWSSFDRGGFAAMGCYDRDLRDKLDRIIEHLEIPADS